MERLLTGPRYTNLWQTQEVWCHNPLHNRTLCNAHTLDWITYRTKTIEGCHLSRTCFYSPVDSFFMSSMYIYICGGYWLTHVWLHQIHEVLEWEVAWSGWWWEKMKKQPISFFIPFNKINGKCSKMWETKGAIKIRGTALSYDCINCAQYRFWCSQAILLCFMCGAVGCWNWVKRLCALFYFIILV